jgi:hypothetical protein
LLIKIENKKQNKFIVSERLYIGITDTINGFRSTLACCEVRRKEEEEEVGGGGGGGGGGRRGERSE